MLGWQKYSVTPIKLQDRYIMKIAMSLVYRQIMYN